MVNILTRTHFILLKGYKDCLPSGYCGKFCVSIFPHSSGNCTCLAACYKQQGIYNCHLKLVMHLTNHTSWTSVARPRLKKCALDALRISLDLYRECYSRPRPEMVVNSPVSGMRKYSWIASTTNALNQGHNTLTATKGQKKLIFIRHRWIILGWIGK